LCCVCCVRFKIEDKQDLNTACLRLLQSKYSFPKRSFALSLNNLFAQAKLVSNEKSKLPPYLKNIKINNGCIKHGEIKQASQATDKNKKKNGGGGVGEG
jgi:hypothetical protein